MVTKTGRDIFVAASLLKAGELVAIPTETVYGLAANALNENAVVKIFKAKNRPFFNPLIVHCASLEAASPFVKNIPAWAIILAENYSPGPISFLLPKSDLIPDLVTAGKEKVAIRIPNHPLTRELLKTIDFPLAAPSANPFGYVSPVSAAHVKESLGGKLPYILDGGESKVGVESTIVEEAQNGGIIIRRTGAITPEMIETATGIKPLLQTHGENPDAPGMLKSHYSTHTPLYFADLPELPEKPGGYRVLLLGWGNAEENLAILAGKSEIHSFEMLNLSPNHNLDEVAAGLFTALRKADQADVDFIFAPQFPSTGLGLAINDRLRRAAHRFL